MVRFAIIGYDHAHILRYAPAIAQHPRSQLVVIVAPGANQALAKQDARRFGAKYLEELTSLRSKEGVQAAYLGTPPIQHLAVIQALAPQGIHILCDKPLATTLPDADAILRLTGKHGVRLMVPFNPRYQLPVMRLKETINAGDLGEIKHIHATKYGKLPRNIAPLDTDWFFDRAQAGFGGFADIGIHAIDALRWLAGSEARRVYAKIGKLIHQDISTDDIGSMIVEFKNGVVGSQQSGWANPAGNSSWLSVNFEVLGTKGSVLIDRPYHDLELVDESRAESLAWWREDINMLVNEFVSAVEENRPPAITGQDGRAALEITIAAYRSAESGRPVSLPL